MKASTKVKILSVATIGMGMVTGAYATPLLSNDTMEGLPSLGTQIGGFTEGLAPGLFKFLLLIGLAVAIVGLIVGIIYVIKKQATQHVK